MNAQKAAGSGRTVLLGEFEVTDGYSDVDGQLLYHTVCGGYVTDIDPGDTLARLYRMAGTHRCPGNFQGQGGSPDLSDWNSPEDAGYDEDRVNHDTVREQTGEDT
jgi:hypothetical protein